MMHPADHSSERPYCTLSSAVPDGSAFPVPALVCVAMPIVADIANTLASSSSSIPVCTPFAFGAGALAPRPVDAVSLGAPVATHPTPHASL